MSVNLTLIFEVIAFLAFIYSFKRFLWKPIVTAMENREKTIAEGIEQAERGRRELEQAEAKAEEAIAEARRRANDIVDGANRRAAEIVEEARAAAETERVNEVERARAEIEQAARQAREVLRGEFARIATEAAGRIVEHELDPQKQRALVEDLAESLAGG